MILVWYRLGYSGDDSEDYDDIVLLDFVESYHMHCLVIDFEHEYFLSLGSIIGLEIHAKNIAPGIVARTWGYVSVFHNRNILCIDSIATNRETLDFLIDSLGETITTKRDVWLEKILRIGPILLRGNVSALDVCDSGLNDPFMGHTHH